MKYPTEEVDEKAAKLSIANEIDPKPARYSAIFEASPAMDDFILNQNADPKSTWKANECLLTKGNENYDKFKCEKRSLMTNSDGAGENSKVLNQAALKLGGRKDEPTNRFTGSEDTTAFK